MTAYGLPATARPSTRLASPRAHDPGRHQHHHHRFAATAKMISGFSMMGVVFTRRYPMLVATAPRGGVSTLLVMQLNHDRLAKHPSTLRRRWGPMLARLTRTTHFDWEELESLCFAFHKLTRGSKGRMTRKEFIDIMHHALDMTNTANVDYSYKNLDPNNNLYISMEDWCRGISVMLRGSLEEKIKFCFETYDRYGEHCLRRKNLIWMVTENWKASTDLDCQVQIEELLETVMSSVAADSDKGIVARDYRKAVNKYPMLLEFLGEVLPSRPAAATFMATMMPRARPYEHCPEHRTERLPDPKPFLAFGATGSQEVVRRLGAFNHQVTRAASDPDPSSLALPE